MTPALLTKISIGLICDVTVEKAVSIAGLSTTSATNVCTCVVDELLMMASRSALAVARLALSRPNMTTLEAWAWTKALAIAAPIPLLPPVMRTVFPAQEFSGLVGSMAG